MYTSLQLELRPLGDNRRGVRCSSDLGISALEVTPSLSHINSDFFGLYPLYQNPSKNVILARAMNASSLVSRCPGLELSRG